MNIHNNRGPRTSAGTLSLGEDLYSVSAFYFLSFLLFRIFLHPFTFNDTEHVCRYEWRVQDVTVGLRLGQRAKPAAPGAALP